ncbi:MAG: tetratricopeptide repeat protein [Burkholderiaceae bacterium]|nr:tetratricopeptide repeat protein [Burkholderiaceae bacterium]
MRDRAPTRLRITARRLQRGPSSRALRALLLLQASAGLALGVAQPARAQQAAPAAAAAAAPTSPAPAASPAQELQRLAEAGDLAAIVRLAVAYRDGSSGLARNPALALQWLVRAAERDNVSAMTEAAWGHLQGWGGQRNEVEAARWYRRAADKGDAAGAYWLSEFHRQGWGGVTQNTAEMLRWLRVAAEAGNAGAMRDLGAAHEQGLGLAADRAQALRWYQRAEAAGAPVAADITRLGGRPVTAAVTAGSTGTAGAAGSGTSPPPTPARDPNSVVGTYACRVSGNITRTNGFGERTPDFADATLEVTVAEDRSATFTFSRPPYKGSLSRSGNQYSWSEEWTSDSGNERRRTNIGFSLSGLRAEGGRNERTLWRQVGSSQLRGSWEYNWVWTGNCRRNRE